MPKKIQSSSTSTLENFFVSEGHRALYTEITYLKKRIHLVEGERKANYESNEAIIKKNEAILKDIKEKNKELKAKRKSIVDVKGNYFKKISEMVGGEKKAYEFRGKDIREIIDILEYKIGSLRNKLNVSDFKRAHYTKEIADLSQQEGALRKRLVKKTGHHDPRIEELKTTETSTAAMQMKTTEAENVRTRYKHMLSVLKDENFTQNIKLTDLEKMLKKQEGEILRIQTVLQDAHKARKEAKYHLLQAEEETIQEFSKREQELYEARMKLKIIREKMESIGSKLTYPKFHIIHRDSSITDGLFPQMTTSLEQDGGAKSLTSIEAVYNELQELTGESDPKQLIERFEKQRRHAKELVKDEQVMKSAVRKAKLRQRFLADKLGQLQFSGGLTREELNEKADEIDGEITSTTTERDRLDNIINEHTVMMEQMLSKLLEICQNNDLRYNQPGSTSDSLLGNTIVAILRHILQKTEPIVQEQAVVVTTWNPLLSPTLKRTNEDVITEEERMLLGGGGRFSPTNRFGSTGDVPYSVGGGQSDNSVGISSRRPSIADLSILDNTSSTAIPALDKLSILDGVADIVSATSPLSDGTGFQVQLQLPEEEVRDDTEKPLMKQTTTPFPTKGQESSEEEEAVTRNFVKRQSQILFEAKTRKGRFNTNTTPAPRFDIFVKCQTRI